MALGLVPPIDELEEEPRLPPMKSAMHWYDIPSKPMLAGLVVLFAGVVLGLFTRVEGNAKEAVQNLTKAVEQFEDNQRTRTNERVAKTEVQVATLERSMVKLTDAVEESTKINGKVLQELARINGVLAAKGIDR